MRLDEKTGRAQNKVDSGPYNYTNNNDNDHSNSSKQQQQQQQTVPPGFSYTNINNDHSNSSNNSSISYDGLTSACLLALNDSDLSCKQSKALLEQLEPSESSSISAQTGSENSYIQQPFADFQDECYGTAECDQFPFLQPSQAGCVSWQPMTLVVRKLPRSYTQQMLLAALNQAGYAYTYDFVYLPMGESSPGTLPRPSLGHAYINFVHPVCAQTFKESFHDQQLGRCKNKVSVGEARLQGFKANYAHYLPSRVNHRNADPAARPLFLREPTDEELQELGGKFATGRGRSRRCTSELPFSNSCGRSDIDRAVLHQSYRVMGLPALPEDATVRVPPALLTVIDANYPRCLSLISNKQTRARATTTTAKQHINKQNNINNQTINNTSNI
ncbi:unnamed protein product [Polarella glacialis]|uniref:Mei2-like C-terminal RNA recognition motif domain-containing protein n=1 Tax=Polarella glacialis TaxID=89957 RepID=A0A813IKE1_POLGL|nr:unnamed protein product [Polarella glacialis]